VSDYLRAVLDVYALFASVCEVGLFAVFVMTVGAGLRQGSRSVRYSILVFGLSSLVRRHASVPQALDELGPIRIPYRNIDSIRAFAAREVEQISNFGNRQCAILDR
jgi:hypothetical protein